MTILCCGDRYWSDEARIYETLKDYPIDTKIIHGAAKGADSLADKVARELGMKNVIAVRANWAEYGRAAGPIRNKQMLDLNPDLVIAFHNHIQASKGTANMIKQAKDKGTEVKLVTSY